MRHKELGILERYEAERYEARLAGRITQGVPGTKRKDSAVSRFGKPSRFERGVKEKHNKA